MRECPECGFFTIKWESPFYVCSKCGLTLRRHELNELISRKKRERLERDLQEEGKEKYKRQREYLDWYMGKGS